MGKHISLFHGLIVRWPSASLISTLEERRYERVQKWLAREEGQGLVEYGLIIFLVAIVVIAILVLLGPQIGSIFSGITSSI